MFFPYLFIFKLLFPLHFPYLCASPHLFQCHISPAPRFVGRARSVRRPHSLHPPPYSAWVHCRVRPPTSRNWLGHRSTMHLLRPWNCWDSSLWGLLWYRIYLYWYWYSILRMMVFCETFATQFHTSPFRTPSIQAYPSHLLAELLEVWDAR